MSQPSAHRAGVCRESYVEQMDLNQVPQLDVLQPLVVTERLTEEITTQLAAIPSVWHTVLSGESMAPSILSAFWLWHIACAPHHSSLCMSEIKFGEVGRVGCQVRAVSVLQQYIVSWATGGSMNKLWQSASTPFQRIISFLGLQGTKCKQKMGGWQYGEMGATSKSTSKMKRSHRKW